MPKRRRSKRNYFKKNSLRDGIERVMARVDRQLREEAEIRRQINVRKKSLSDFQSRQRRKTASIHRKRLALTNKKQRSVKYVTRTTSPAISRLKRRQVSLKHSVYTFDQQKRFLREEICRKRHERRKTLFAFDKIGKGIGGPKRRALKPESKVRC